MVKYCNAACKKKHRHKHKKDCDEHLRLAAVRAAELHDEALFKQPPLPFDDCPICFLRIPAIVSGSTYMPCCGKVMCNGCFYAPVLTNEGNRAEELCPFCRTPEPNSSKEENKRYEKRAEIGDPIAIYNIGGGYFDGEDKKKAMELWHKAGELGYAPAYQNIGCSNMFGMGVKVDKKKAMHYWELAAMRGINEARCNLGVEEENAGNIERAIKHYIIAARDGNSHSVKNIQDLYMDGDATKHDYATALHAYQEYLKEIKSDTRDKAAAAKDKYKYY